MLVLGGFDSILGAIVGGLIIGAGEKLSEVYIGAFFGGGIESWFAYVIALAFLLVRPAGLSAGSSWKKPDMINPSASRFPSWLGPVALLAVAYGVFRLSAAAISLKRFSPHFWHSLGRGRA